MTSTKKQLFLLAILLLGVSFVTAQEKSKVVSKYDKKKDVTTLRLKPFRLTTIIQEKESSTHVPLHQTDLEISYGYPGETPSKPIENVEFRFQVSSSNYTFLRSQTVMAVLDNEGGNGRAFSLGTTDYKSHPTKFNSIFEETLVVQAPPDALAKMAKANNLQIYLGPIVYSVAPKHLEAIKELAGTLPPAAAAVKSN